MDNKYQIKFPELKEAKDALKAYFHKHNLNPLKSYSKHPIHGRAVSDLVQRVNIERAKILDNYVVRDLANTKKLVKLQLKKYQDMALKKKTKKTPKETTAPKVEVKKESKKLVKETTKKAAPTKYDYPLIDGREMTKEEKKKYRSKLRKEGSDNKPSKEKKPSKANKAPKEETKPVKKVKKEKTPEKPLKKVKSKKLKKEKTPEKPLKKVKSKKLKKEED